MVLFEIVRELNQGTLSMDTLRMLDPPYNMKGDTINGTNDWNRDDYYRTLLSRIRACNERNLDDLREEL